MTSGSARACSSRACTARAGVRAGAARQHVVAELASETDFEGFRRAARGLLRGACAPDAVQWAVAGSATPDLFAPAASPDAAERGAWPDAADPADPADSDASANPASPTTAPSVATPRVPADFVELCRRVILHRDPARFALLYRLLWRIVREPALRHDPLDPEMAQARLMAQAVRRDLHKMKAFVRFREVAQGDGEPPLHVAWFEPEHHIVQAVAPFFVRRFTAMRWAILTPDASLHWDGEHLHPAPGASRQQAPPADGGEALWLTYYASIFNPARLKLKMMQKEMPRRYWHNLPEATLISALAAQAGERNTRMVLAEPEPTARRLTPQGVAPRAHGVMPITLQALPATGASLPDRVQSLAQHQQAAAACRHCPLGALATQTVWGAGPMNAPLMLVGEQPGDQEDLQGLPFVGPAGQLLDRAMAQLGWDRSTVYVTNAVKHFKYEPRGKRRMHKTPAQKEADACQHWLDAEIALVQPQALVALGATAARQLLGRPVAVLSERGQWLQRADGLPVLVTLHPAALLRAEAGEREAAYASWLADLRLAALRVVAGGFSLPAASGTPAPRVRAGRGT